MSDRVSSFYGTMQLDQQVQLMQSQMTQLTGEIFLGGCSRSVGGDGQQPALLYHCSGRTISRPRCRPRSGWPAAARPIQTAMTNISSAVQSVVTAALGPRRRQRASPPTRR